MINLQDMFLQYNDEKALKDSDYEEMREKRDLILAEIKDRKGENIPTFTTLNLGSYKLKTGVNYNDNNYDIDCAIRLNIKKDEIKDFSSNEMKTGIYDAIKDIRKKEYNTKCVTAKYLQDNKPTHHLDFPVFAFDQQNQIYFLADGKKDNVEWVDAEPEKLIDHLNLESDVNIIEQYRRVIRYLKLWKSKVFSHEKKNACPPSIGLNIETREIFDSYSGNLEDIDLLIQVSNSLKNNITIEYKFTGEEYHIYKKVPYSPNNDNVYFKMDAESELVETYYNKINELLNVLEKAKNHKSLESACNELRKVFPDFPYPPKEKAEKSFVSNATYGQI